MFAYNIHSLSLVDIKNNVEVYMQLNAGLCNFSGVALGCAQNGNVVFNLWCSGLNI